MTSEYGVRFDNGKRTFVAGGYALEAAEHAVATMSDPKRHHPVADCVMVREVGDWVPLSSPGSGSGREGA